MHIVDIWGGCSREVEAIIGRRTKEATYANEKPDCIEKVYISIDIDDTQRIAVNNYGNIYDFVRQPNGNAVFNGRKSIEIDTSAQILKIFCERLMGSITGARDN